MVDLNKKYDIQCNIVRMKKYESKGTKERNNFNNASNNNNSNSNNSNNSNNNDNNSENTSGGHFFQNTGTK